MQGHVMGDADGVEIVSGDLYKEDSVTLPSKRRNPDGDEWCVR